MNRINICTIWSHDKDDILTKATAESVLTIRETDADDLDSLRGKSL
jgi:hypothetical protein